ncbi:MAG: adenylate/guanylate cyclase domain-containing protein, partial [Chloroflexota bacterium]|nr:adenylate/guanylate cyclase domain-containing protein [Chloroflexota bacterium]
MKLRGKQRLIIGIFLVAIANAIMLWLLHLDGLNGPNTFFRDLMMQKSVQRPDPRITIVAIDDKSLQTYGRLGAWDRAHYADLIRSLKDAGARVVAFDVAFIDPTPSDPRIAQAIQYAQSGSAPMTVAMAVEGDQLVARPPGQGLAYQFFDPITRGIAAGRPLPANVTVDPDGASVRHLPLRAISKTETFYLLPLVAANAYLGLPPLEQSAKLQPSALLAARRSIPTDPTYRMLVNFVGPPHSFASASLSDVADRKIDLSTFKDKLVFVGEYGSTMLADNYPVPTATEAKPKMDGVEIWANGAQNILNGKFVVDEDAVITAVLLVLLSCLAAASFFLWGAAGWLVALATVGVYSLARFLLTVSQLNSATNSAGTISLPGLVYVDGGILLASALPFLYFFMYEQGSKRTIRRMFGKYVTPEVAEHIMSMRESGELSLGGQVKDATIMFGDIRGFTTLSEGMEPEAVMAMLNRYFDKMVEIIIKHGG